jgi:hypothetical protein
VSFLGGISSLTVASLDLTKKPDWSNPLVYENVYKYIFWTLLLMGVQRQGTKEILSETFFTIPFRDGSVIQLVEYLPIE